MPFVLLAPLVAQATELEVKKRVDPAPVAGAARCVARVTILANGRPTEADVRGCDAAHAEAAKAAVLQWQWKKLVDQADTTAFVQLSFPAGTDAPRPAECLWRFELAKSGELTTLAQPDAPCASWMQERVAEMTQMPSPGTCRGVYTDAPQPDLSGCAEDAQRTLKHLVGDRRFAFAPADRNVVELVIPVDYAPRLFDAAALRDALVVGTTMRFRMEAQGKPAIEERWTFTAHTDDSCTIASKVVDPTSGALVEDQGEQIYAWTELEGHATFPAHLTSIEDSEIKVPAGKFQTRKYTIREEDGTVRVLHFAKTLPGPPVSMVVRRGEEVLSSMVLLERSGP